VTVESHLGNFANLAVIDNPLTCPIQFPHRRIEHGYLLKWKTMVRPVPLGSTGGFPIDASFVKARCILPQAECVGIDREDLFTAGFQHTDAMFSRRIAPEMGLQ
jgi:hypothetical protein